MSWQGVVYRLRALLFRRRLERDLDDELAFHGALAAERGSQRRFGNELRLREEARAQWMFAWLEALGQDLRFAWRGLRRAPGFAAAVVITLALGIGANSAIFSLAYAVLWQPLPYPDAARIVEVRQAKGAVHLMMNAQPELAEARTQSLGLASLAMYRRDGATLTAAGDAAVLQGAEVEAGLLRLLGAQPLLGRLISPGDDHPGAAPVVDISAYLWRQHFHSSPAVVGQRINLDSKPYTVIGVLPDWFTYPSSGPFLASWKTAYWRAWQEVPTFSSRVVSAVARLAPGVSIEQAQQRMDLEMQRLVLAHPTDRGRSFELTPLRSFLVGNVTPALWMMLAVVALVLLITSANVACLLSARAQLRARELATRTALGASRGRIVRQLWTETLVLVTLGAGVGLALAALGITLLRAAAPGDLPRLAHVGLNWPVVAFTAAVALLVAVAFGLAPALSASGRQLDATLRPARTAVGTHSGQSRQAWIVVQVSVALLLLVAAGLLLTALGRMLATPLGFEPGQVLSFGLPLPPAGYPNAAARLRLYQSAEKGIAALPGVQSAAMVSYLPFHAPALTFYSLPGHALLPGQESPLIAYNPVSSGYLPLMHIPILMGRGLAGADSASSPPVVVINQAAAQMIFPGRNPIGQRIQFVWSQQPPLRTVVGVAGNTRSQFGAAPAPPLARVYVPLAQSSAVSSAMKFVIRATGNPLALVPSVERTVHALDPQIPVASPAAFTDLYAGVVAQPRFRGYLVAGFALLALLLTAVGVYGVLAFMVGGRTQEYGVRAVLGARPAQVLTLVLRQALTLVAIGLALGLAAAVALTRYLHALLYGVSPTDPWVLAATIILLAIVSLAAAWFPAHRAMAVDPARALRWE